MVPVGSDLPEHAPDGARPRERAAEWPGDTDDREPRVSLLARLDALRRRLVRAALALTAGFLLAFTFIGPIVGSVIYTMLQAVVKMYTVYWPLTIGTIILLIVLFVLSIGANALVGRFGGAIPTGLFDNAGIDDFLTRLFAMPGLTNDFRQLKRRLFLIATDLDSGASVAFGSRGHDHVPIAKAIQASSALPGLFPPVEIDGHWFVDGALKKTLHASVALKEGARLVICVNPLVPFDASRAAHERHLKRRRLVDGGLPVVLAQTFRAIIHSRMKTGLAKYDMEYGDADVVLFEPNPDDADMFFTNMFSYADRRRLSQQAYRNAREELLRRHDELAPKLARHGVSINRAVLEDPHRSLARRMAQLQRRRAGAMGLAALRLSDTLDDLAATLRRLRHRQHRAA